MWNNFLFIALPYIALAVCAIGTVFRIRYMPLSNSALSSQFLESKTLMWGSLFWHLSIFGILFTHIFALCCPELWNRLLANNIVLVAVESLGLTFGILSFVGLTILLLRRVLSSKIQAVSSVMDIIVVLLLMALTGFGIATATLAKWGSLWSTATVVPYMHSIFTLQPDPSFVEDLPVVVRAHILCAWLFVLAVPFSRLIHVFALPLQYLFRPPQNVVWNNARRKDSAPQIYAKDEARRSFILGTVGVTAGGALLSVGVLDKIFRFFFGPRLGQKEESELMEERIKRLEITAEQKKLELERQQSNYILVSSLKDLNSTKGRYFIDYLMRPALAFKGDNGLPILISAKCTHLGCTVGNQVNSEKKILCPCHVSFFDINTGQPNPDSPAKAPLPMLGWVIMDQLGKTVASCSPAGKVEGQVDANNIDGLNVYITKVHTEIA
jgi:nitrate reductase gamma subunit